MPALSPARGRPERAPLEGERVRLEPVDPERHTTDLFAAAQGDPRLWEYLPYGPFADEAEMREHLARQAASEDPLFFAVITDGRAVGVVSLMRIEPAHGVIEIGHIWFGAPLQRTPAATETIYVLARHAFDALGNRRLEWKCDAANARSRRAAERFGFVYEGVFRQHMIVKGRNRDTAWYAILDGDWPVVRAAFEAWLAPENFDAGGAQRRTLEALRGYADAAMTVDLVIDIENSPGALAGVAAAISDAGVNIAAATCIGGGERAELHILVPHAGAARHSLAISHLAVTREREVVVVDVEDTPGVLADLTRKIAKAGIDLDLVYIATRNRVVFGAPDLGALRAALDSS